MISDSDDADKDSKTSLGVRFWWSIGLIAAFIVATLLISYTLIPQMYVPPVGSGEFGDMFGAPNALFSGLAFLGVIAAIVLQTKELQFQRQELEETRQELKGQRDQLAIQSKTFARQTFDNTFFQMLSLHNEIVDSIDVAMPHRNRLTGRDCFKHFRDIMNQSGSSTINVKEVARNRDDVSALYLRMYEQQEADLGHYFRTLYNMVKFVDQSDLENKKFYANLIRAQLSRYELVLLFYNCISPKGAVKFRPLVEKYAMLKHLNPKDLFMEGHKLWYEDSAYT